MDLTKILEVIACVPAKEKLHSQRANKKNQVNIGETYLLSLRISQPADQNGLNNFSIALIRFSLDNSYEN